MAVASIEFEFLVINNLSSSKISSVSSLVQDLLVAEQLWSNAEISDNDGVACIFDSDNDITLYVLPLEAAFAGNDQKIEGFVVKLVAKQVEAIESLRLKLIHHLTEQLHFSSVSILRDDASGFIARQLFPLLYQVENKLRRFITQFFIRKVGLAWFEHIVHQCQLEERNPRLLTATELSPKVTLDLLALRFSTLGTLIVQPYQYFKGQKALANRILNASTFEDFKTIKAELEGNYLVFLKKYFIDKHFEKVWSDLSAIRNRLEHNGYFVKADMDNATQWCTELNQMVSIAEEKLKGASVETTTKFLPLVETKEALFADVSRIFGITRTPANIDLKIVGKIDLPEPKRKTTLWEVDTIDEKYNVEEKVKEEDRIITEEELLEQLGKAQKWHMDRGMEYVGLKGFVTKWLASNHFSVPPAYAIVNQLKEQGKVDVYDVAVDGYDFPVKAIKLADVEKFEELAY